MFPTFQQVYAPLKEEVEKLENGRLAITKRIKLHSLVTVICLVLMVACIAFIDPVMIFMVIAIAIYAGVTIFLINRRYKQFRVDFKRVVVWRLAQEMLRQCSLPYETDSYRYDIQYHPNQRISNQSMNASRLFDYRIDKIRGEDLFFGVLGLTEFKFSELTVIQERTDRDSNGRKTTRDVTMFNGIFFIADFHKDFNGVTVLKSGHLFNTGAIGRFFQPLRNTMSKLSQDKKRGIELENEEFNRAFHVETTDDITARYILTSSMMERLLAFKTRHEGTVEASFVQSSMYVTLASGRNYFEPKLRRSLTETQCKMIYDDLCFLFGIIEELDLNTRIWNKV